jgi:hypothetical protein
MLAMITFVKQTIISINYRDGAVEKSKLAEREFKYAVKELPTFWEYCNYVFPL